jgi:hypothetical protein
MYHVPSSWTSFGTALAPYSLPWWSLAAPIDLISTRGNQECAAARVKEGIANVADWKECYLLLALDFLFVQSASQGNVPVFDSPDHFAMMNLHSGAAQCIAK